MRACGLCLIAVFAGLLLSLRLVCPCARVQVIYFAGRALAGEDDLAALTSRMAMYNSRCEWIRERAPWMRSVLRAKLVPEEQQQQEQVA